MKKGNPLKLKSISVSVVFNEDSLYIDHRSTPNHIAGLSDSELGETAFYKAATWSVYDGQYEKTRNRTFPRTLTFYIPTPSVTHFNYEQEKKVVGWLNEHKDSFLLCAAEFAIKLIGLIKKVFPTAGFTVMANISYTGTGSRKLSVPVELFYDSKEGFICWDRAETETIPPLGSIEERK